MASRSLEARDGYDLGPHLNVDSSGRAYIAIAVVWSSVLFAGLIALASLRNLTFIRIRNVTLSTVAVLTIHVYLVLVFMVYVLNGRYPCNFEYWVMSTYFPIGVGLFQAQNVHLLDISLMQKQLLLEPAKVAAKPVEIRSGLVGLVDRWRRLTLVGRTYAFIGLGVVVELTVAALTFFLSRKFVSFGVFGETSSGVECRQGWEWLPSALWQGIWTYAYGPWVLYKIRHIQDVHRWRLQTSLAIVFSLPGLPVVIAAMYSPAFKDINTDWPPPMWFAPGLVVMQFVTVFFPLWEAYEVRYRRKVTLSALDEWEKSREKNGSLSSDSLKQTSSFGNVEKQEKRDMYGMNALERTLSQDSTALLEFAATKEFTGENIIFLNQVRDWKRLWEEAAAATGALSDDARTMLYVKAAELFFNNVCLLTAQFPVNIESKVYVNLEKLFKQEAPISAQKSVVAPFDDDIGRVGHGPGRTDVEAVPAMTPPIIGDTIPRDFDETVFDGAEASVKYMVLTNTWSRYVDACESSSLRSRSTHASSRSSGSSLVSSLFRRRT